MRKKAPSRLMAKMIGSSAGIYIPKKFSLNHSGWKGITNEDKCIMQSGPDHRDYWEAWDRALSNAKSVTAEGRIYSLYYNDSLWCYREPENEEERERLGKFFASKL